VSVFILPPSFEVLRARLAARGSEQPDDLALRLRNARGEVERYREFDYVVINDDADRAAAQLASIIYAERARRERQEHVAREVLASFP
jgi:guanylate kinase